MTRSLGVAALGFPFDFGYAIHRVPYLAPKLERERSRDGSCFNLSAAARNRAKLDGASKVWVDHKERRIYCPPHVEAKLLAALATTGAPR